MDNITEFVVALSQEQRIEAEQNAKKAVISAIGEKPRREDFQTRTFNKYPAWLMGLVICLIVLVMFSAFIVSAMRLYHIGSSEFFATIEDNSSAVVAGVMIIILSEASAVLFTIAVSIIGDSKISKGIMITLAVIATLIALSGNYYVALYQRDTTVFSWFDTFAPPVVTLGAAFVLERFIFRVLEQRHQDQLDFEDALAVYHEQASNPQDHDRFRPLYANALKDKIFEVNKRRYWNGQRLVEIMNTFAPADWSVLVQREMNSDVWFNPPSNQEAIAKEAARQPGFLQAPMPTSQHKQD